MALFGSTVPPVAWCAFTGAATMVAVFQAVIIPMMEHPSLGRRSLERRSDNSAVPYPTEHEHLPNTASATRLNRPRAPPRPARPRSAVETTA